MAPKKEKLAQAEAELAVQMEKLNAKRAQLKEVCKGLNLCACQSLDNSHKLYPLLERHRLWLFFLCAMSFYFILIYSNLYFQTRKCSF